jgi:alcohol dehydrogenase (cytochrome c)
MRCCSIPFSLSICLLGGLGFAHEGLAQGTGAYLTAAQAERGASVYSQTCAVCHGKSLEGTADAPALSGKTFQSQWQSRMALELYGEISESMPPTKPGSLSESEVSSVTAYILKSNGALTGNEELRGGGSTAKISEILSGAPPVAGDGAVSGVPDKVGGRYGRNGPREILNIVDAHAAHPTIDAAAKARFAEIIKPLDKLTPVTDAMLRDPSPNDWLMWRATYNAWGYSPLKEINRENVKNLTVAWTWGLNSTGMTEFTPLVHDGILYVWNYGETVQALDARNGNLLWQFRHEIPAEYHRDVFYRTKRALAIGGNKLIFPTTDMHIIALDMKTGDVVWDVATDDYEKTRRVYNGGPLVVKGKVIMGASGCAPGTVGCFIAAFDLETGKQVWKFNTIAQPGEAGDETWNNVPADKRWGGSIWLPPSYDPELNLLFVGVGSPFPWSSVDRGTYNPKGGGKNGDSLYVNATLAINPDTGKLVWYYQHLPNDTFDQDYAFERIIVPVDWQGAKRKVVITAGKPAVIEFLDAKTGQFLFAKDPGAQNIFTIDPKTGVKTLLPPGPPEGMKRCPSNNGARNFLAGSYDPETSRYYISVNDVCTGKGGDTPDRMIGLDLNTREFAMDIKSRVMQSSAKLTTAGGLLFSASADRYFRAFDVHDGKMLWQMRTQDVPNAFPITYAVDGKQYVAMIVGNPGLIGNGASRASTEYLRPEPTSVLWVWALP